MQYLLDDIARVLAAPIPRRTALRLLSSTIAGGVLTSLGIRSAQAQSPDVFGNNNGNNSQKCGNSTCSHNQSCCTSGSQPFCISQGKTCCGNTGCDSNHICCNTGYQAFVITQGKQCCGNGSCQGHETCCNGKCCAQGYTCFEGKCSSSKYY